MSIMEILVAMSILAVLAMLLLPALSAARERAEAARCMGNLRQVGTALLQMAGDKQGVLTHWYSGSRTKDNPADHWVSQLQSGKYLTAEEIRRFRCSSIPQNLPPNTHNWGFNMADLYGTVTSSKVGGSTVKIYKIITSSHPRPAHSVLLAGVSNGVAPDAPGAATDLRIFPTGTSSLGRIHLPHEGKGEMFFLDGHAEIATPQRLTEISQTFGTPDPSQPVEYYDESHAIHKSPAL